MKLAIMQPYFLPYIGYWQLLANANKFVVYDNIEYTKKGWINRNRYCEDEFFTLPLQKASDFEPICHRRLAETWPQERGKILRKIRSFYRRSPNFNFVYPVIEDIFLCPDIDLFDFIFSSIIKVRNYLTIGTPIIISSSLDLIGDLRGKERVVETCKKATSHDDIVYVNPIGGTGLYRKEDFENHDIELRFLKTKEKGENCLSIIDLMFRFYREELIDKVNNFEEIS